MGTIQGLSPNGQESILGKIKERILIKENLIDLVKMVKELADLALVTRYAKDLRDLLSNGELAERKSFVRSLVREIRVQGQEAVIRYSLPLPSDYANGDSAGVLASCTMVGDSGLEPLASCV